MKLLLDFGLHRIQLGLLRCAAVLTPQSLRAEWRREWQSELWHVRHSCASTEPSSWHAERAACAFCLGAFQDALCLRRHASQSRAPHVRRGASVTQSTLCLAAFTGVCYALSLLLPGVHLESHPSRYQLDPALILIQDSLRGNAESATISIEQFKAWKDRGRRYFDGFAYYRVSHELASNPTPTQCRGQFRAAPNGQSPTRVRISSSS